MLDYDALIEDNFLVGQCKLLINEKNINSINYIHTDFYGHYLNIATVEDLLKRLSAASYEKVKNLPISKLSMYKTSDIGIGRRLHLSIRHIKELIELNKVKEDINIYLKYTGNNIIAYVVKGSIDEKLLLTNDTYVIVNDHCKTVYSIRVGQPANVNKLYFNKELGGKAVDVETALAIDGLNSVYVVRD